MEKYFECFGNNDIDDVQNGVLVHVYSHLYLGGALYGVLHTPNFALSTDEVLLPSTEPYRDITFHFTTQVLLWDALFMSINHDFRFPTVINGWLVEWPPAFLWDFSYGVAVTRNYGDREAMDTLNSKVRSHCRYHNYCPAPYGTYERINLRELAQGEIQTRREGRNAERDSGGCSEEDEKQNFCFSDSMDNVLFLSMLLGSIPVENKSDSGEQEHHEAVGKVKAWMMESMKDEKR
ncbi:hypothetical protein Clacol_004380 [Clathrus columnatus]|uniref:Uncharacterized protein n=1 Tax=Clathrus columnatus TaxID=1419009 RepID=A0AAV5A6A5_9AGAM|nr:hypothetical protein Clacol_004380 [Clathrus columnatus]